MLTKQEQEILLNAPEGAEYYYRDPNTDKYYYSKFSGQARLDTLRKKQGKTVVDAVNYFKGVDSSSDCTHIVTPTKLNTLHQQGLLEFDICNADNARWDNVCTVEEFNQCVKDMSEARWINESGDFFCYESYKEDYQEPTKHTKVEWSNGDKCKWLGGIYTYIGLSSLGCGIVVVESESGRATVASIIELSKPGTPEQKQIDSAVQDIHSAMFDITDEVATDLVTMLQARGHLADYE